MSATVFWRPKEVGRRNLELSAPQKFLAKIPAGEYDRIHDLERFRAFAELDFPGAAELVKALEEWGVIVIEVEY